MTSEAAGDGAPVLRLRGLDLGYGPRRVLAGVELDVRPGEVWFLLGPNGSGKTTLLRGILGLLRPSAGVLERHPQLASRERIGFVPQRDEINPSLPTTVQEFVSLGFVGARLQRGERAERLAWALGQVGLESLAHASFWSLSGGQRQRALVARALVRRPGFMILDEPTEGLDVTSEETFLNTLVSLNHGDGLTLLFVTHKLELAVRHATHVALFHSGHVHAGTRDEVLGSDAVERVFGVTLALDGGEGAALPDRHRVAP